MKITVLTPLFVVVFLCLIDLISSQKSNSKSMSIDDSIKLVKSNSKKNENEFSFSYELNDGQQREETVSISNGGIMSIKGFYEYVGTDGRIYRVEYVADENGYRPTVHVSEVAVVSYISPVILKSLIG